MPTIRVDGKTYRVEDGQTILEALDALGVLMNGVDVPHYCWHPKLSVDGSCRLCQVEVEGVPKLQIACDTEVREGMVIHTQNERVRRAREGVMELLLVNHPLDCAICDQAGECKLQDHAYDYGVAQARSVEPRRALKKRVPLGPGVVFDQERCILCRRCVRFCREIPGTSELGIFNRGDASVIEMAPGETLDNAYSMNVADICPVGALTTSDFRFKIRVWFLEEVDGICTGCANGCNVSLGVAKNEVQRYVPRRNDAVNDTWICDAGRLSYKRIGAADRATEPLVRNGQGGLERVDWSSAIDHAAARLARLIDARGVGVIAGIASADATNEDLYTFRRFLQALGTESAGIAVVRGDSDDLLVKPEKGANATGARELGFAEADSVLERIRGGAIHGLIVLGGELPVVGADTRAADQEIAERLSGLDTVVLLQPHHSELERVAHVVLPVLVAAEKEGTLTNHAGRVQRVRPAVAPGWEAYSEGEAITRLAGALGLEGFENLASGTSYDPAAVLLEISRNVPAFAGVSVESVGRRGRPLANRLGDL